MRVALITVLLLVASNVFMTIAWYGHLKHKDTLLWKVILISWFIAFFEYCLQVPANRIGHGTFTAAQLKILQEAITIGVFLIFSWLYLKETARWNEWVAMCMIIGAVVVANLK